MLDPAPEPAPVPPITPSEPPAPATPPAGSGRPTLAVERIGALIEVVLCSGLPTQLLVFGALTGFGLQPRTDDGGWSSSFVIAISMVDMVLVIGLVCLFLRAHREPLGEFILGKRRPLREAALGLALIPAAFALVVLVLGLVLAVEPELHNVPVNPFERMMQAPQDAAVFAFVAMFAGGVREEIQRAFIVRRFDQYLGGAIIGIVLYGAVFGLGHIDQGYAPSIAIGALGAAWGCVYWWRRSVVAPMVSHAGFNLAQLLKYVTLSAGVQ